MYHQISSSLQRQVARLFGQLEKKIDYSPSYSDNPKKNISTTSSSRSSTAASAVPCHTRGLVVAHSRKLSATLGGSSSRTCANYRQRSGARRRALAQTIGNARGLDINSPRSTENHLQDLRLHRHQQRDNPNNARGLDNNFASDRGFDSTTTTRLRHR
jgi:hypothetical protein